MPRRDRDGRADPISPAAIRPAWRTFIRTCTFRVPSGAMLDLAKVDAIRPGHQRFQRPLPPMMMKAGTFWMEQVDARS